LNDTEIAVNIIDDFDNPKPGPSGINTKKNVTIDKDQGGDKVRKETDDSDSGHTKPSAAQLNSKLSNQFNQSDDDSADSIQIIGYKKPLHERTPEMIAISSESEIDVETLS